MTELAKRVGVLPQTVSHIELGNKPAGLNTLIKIARELDVSVDVLILSPATGENCTGNTEATENETAPDEAVA